MENTFLFLFFSHVAWSADDVRRYCSWFDYDHEFIFIEQFAIIDNLSSWKYFFQSFFLKLRKYALIFVVFII